MTFYISDDGQPQNEFYVYRCRGIDGEGFTSENDIKVGDNVVIYDRLVNYKGNTPETVANGAHIYSINDAPYGIQDVALDHNFTGKIYNLQGIEVGKDYKDIVIQGGKKVLVK